MNPSVLLVTAYRWASSARIGISFAEAGWTVDAVCPRGHIFQSTKAVRRLHDCRFFAIPYSIRRAICKSKPDLIVPCDDVVAGHLRHFCDSDRPSSTSNELRALLVRSLGDPSYYNDFDSRSRIAGIGREVGVPTPETAIVRTFADLEAWAKRNELPAVLKADGSFGGNGVRIVSSLDEARNALAILGAPTDLARAVKRALADNNETYLMSSIKRTRPIVNVQRCISGGEVTCSVACWQGEVLACTTLRVIRTNEPLGTSTVVQVIEDHNILQAVEKMSRRLQISGVYGFDFVQERGTGRSFLIEINPRATPTTHLRTAAGSLPFALRLALTGQGTKLDPLYQTGDTIALFPQEWLRDQKSDFLHNARQDIPWSEPDFCWRASSKKRGSCAVWGICGLAAVENMKFLGPALADGAALVEDKVVTHRRHLKLCAKGFVILRRITRV